MHFFSSTLLFFISAGVARAAAVPVAAGELNNRAASCTFTDAASATKAKTSCPTLTLNNVAVPAGKTLDLTGLPKGTHV